MTIWVTKYLFTKGILEFKDAEVNPAYPNMANAKRDGYRISFHGKDWHTSLAAAQVHAEVVRAKKLLAIEKQAKKIRALTF